LTSGTSRSTPEARRLDAAIERTTDRADQLGAEDRFNQRWHHDHPEHTARIHQLEDALACWPAVRMTMAATAMVRMVGGCAVAAGGQGVGGGGRGVVVPIRR
jgi:hypothetical protein